MHNEQGMKMSIESGVLGVAITKFGWLKLLTLGYAVIGAAMMAVFRPPKSRKEMMLQAAVALGSSFLFGDLFIAMANNWINLGDEWRMPIHGLIGAFSWGAFGGLAHLRDRVQEDPLQVVKDVHDVL